MRQLWNLANQLTLFRLLLVPLILIAMLYGRHGAALVLFLVAAVTDGIDGVVARKLNQKTPLGAYLDPIADKLLLSSSFFVLSLIRSVPWWVTILILGRDVMIVTTTGVVVLATNIREFPPSTLGKANTAVQIVTVFGFVLRNAYPWDWVVWTTNQLVWLAAAATLASGAHYAIRTSRQLARHTDTDATATEPRP
jgi:cardiolipin synthase